MIVVGVDEAGRGPLAGPVVAAAVMATREQLRGLASSGLKDSKKLSPRKREEFFALFREWGILWRAQAASAVRIDRTNILRASLWAMYRSVMQLPLAPDLVVVDGRAPIPGLPFPQRGVVGGDEKVLPVAAASVVAKVLRDRAMVALDRLYPHWGFRRHKGYPTREHRVLVHEIGLSPIHRRSFACGE
ncbi:MAG: ribonuclease HII [Synergistales bacterium]|nr:ribonuclease HII [Synergistales bacterium]